MHARIQYLIAEGFEILQLRGWAEQTASGDAMICYRSSQGGAQPRLYSEHYFVSRSEYDACCRLVTTERH